MSYPYTFGRIDRTDKRNKQALTNAWNKRNQCKQNGCLQNDFHGVHACVHCQKSTGKETWMQRYEATHNHNGNCVNFKESIAYLKMVKK